MNIFWKRLKIRPESYLIASYLLTLLISSALGITFLQTILGLILLLILPGYMLLPYFGMKKNFHPVFVYFISIPISICILAIPLIFISRFRESAVAFDNIVLLLAINIVILLITSFFKTKNDLDFKSNCRLLDLWPICLPFILLVITWVIYPFLPGDDTYILANTLQQSVDQKTIIQPILDRRPIFTPYLLLIFYTTKLSVINILQYLLPLLTTLSFVLPANLLITKSKNNWKNIIYVLTFLASPYLFFQIQYSIPQSFILILLFPLFIILYYGLKHKEAPLIGLALIISFISLNFHEIGFILLLASLIGLFIYLKELYKTTEKKYFWLILFASLFYLLPYILLADIGNRMAGLINVVRYVTKGFFDNIQPRLWYVNYYQNPDGITFSYPGIMGIVWYCYLGALIFIPALYLLIKYIKQKKAKSNKELVSSFPLLLFIVIFFLIAEFYPRLAKIAFLPERAWIFLASGLSLYTVFLISSSLNNKAVNKTSRSINLPLLLVIFVIFIGSTASIYLATTKGILMSKKDYAASMFIKDIDRNAMIVSTQAYEIGTVVYGNKDFIYLPLSQSFNSYDEFEKLVLTEYMGTSENKPFKQVLTTYNSAGEEIYKKESILDKTPDVNNPVYFVYSLNRFSNTKFIGRPDYLSQNDSKNKGLFFSDEFAQKAVFNDNNTIIFRIR